MSVNVSIKTEKRFDEFKTLYERLADRDLSIMVLADDNEFCAFCSMKRATRYITVCAEDYGYEVRITSMASREDYNLFRHAVDVVMRWFEATALIEGDDESPIDCALTVFSDDWITEQMRSDVSMITAIAFHDVDMQTGKSKPECHEIVIDGPFRKFALGKRLFEGMGIKASGNDPKLVEQLYDRMLHVQWGLPDDLRETDLMEMDLDGEGLEENFKRVTMYFYGKHDFISEAEFVVIQKEGFCKGGNKFIIVRYEDMLTIVPKTWERVDNKQLLVHETSPQEFAEFWSKALDMVVISA